MSSSHDKKVRSDDVSLTKVGGSIGLSACFVGLGIFLLSCFGMKAGFALGLIPMALSALGMILSIAGGGWRAKAVENTPVLAAIAVNGLGLIGSLFLVAVWMNWPIFYLPASEGN